MILFEALMGAMRSTLEFYLSFSGPLLSLALLSCSVFVVMWPLYKFGDTLLAGEKKRKVQMQAELDSITALSGGSRKYFYTQEIYRRYGYSPLYSLLGLFGLAVQLPFFLAAYYMLHDYQAFSGLAAGPFRDLMQPDALLQFSGATFHLLPLLMTCINLLAAYYYAETAQEKSKIWLFPALFLLLLYQQPVALVFYWTMNNVFSLLKNLWQARRRAAAKKNWWAIPELKPVNTHRARAVHLALFFFALFLSVFYFVDGDKSKEIPSLWINSALVLLFYLALYYTCFSFQSKTYWHKGLQILRALLLLTSLGLFLRILQLHWAARDISDLGRELVLNLQIQALRPLAWFSCFGAILIGFVVLGSRALLWPQGLALGYRQKIKGTHHKGTHHKGTHKSSLWRSRCCKRYLLSLGIVFVAMFWTASARVIASDPGAFEGNSNFLLLAANLLLFCLLPLAFMALLYLLLPMALRYYCSYLAAVAAWFFSLNVLLFPGNYGPMEFTSFLNPLQVSQNSMITSALLLGGLLLLLFKAYLKPEAQKAPGGKLDQVLPLFLLLHFGFIFLSICQVARYHADLASKGAAQKNINNSAESSPSSSPKNSQSSSQQMPQAAVQLSRDGRNVVILMLDKLMGGLVPYILEADPELAQRLDGFIFYPNTVSQAQRTYGGFHPIVGGSEYTVDKMNANQRPLAADIVEAFTMIPKAFHDSYPEGNFRSYFVNVDYVVAPKARGIMLERLAEEQVAVLQTTNDYNLLPEPDLARGGNKELKWQNFLALLGLFQGFGPIFRQKIYNHGKWMGMLGNSDAWASIAFWKPYIELLSLNGFFAADEQIEGAYVLFHNQLPHNSDFINSHDYFANQENFRFPLLKAHNAIEAIEAQNFVGDEADRANEADEAKAKNFETFFLANYETLYLVADWLDSLKEQKLYDNTLIYLASDHGASKLDPSFQKQSKQGYCCKARWHSLYMRKDFGARGPLRSSDEFRTMADIPAELLPQFGITQNPYSGKTLEPVRTEPVPLYVVEGIRRSEELAGNDRQYYIHSQFNVHNRNIFDDANWEPVP